MLYHNEIRDYVTTRAQAAVDKREAADAAKRDAYDKFLAAKQGEAARQRAAAARAAGIAVAEQQRKAAEEPIHSFLDEDDEGVEGTTSQSNCGPKPLRPATPGSNGGPAPTRRSRYGNSLPTDPTDSRRS
jgi:membrane protein involved in colicin uptake